MVVREDGECCGESGGRRGALEGWPENDGQAMVCSLLSCRSCPTESIEYIVNLQQNGSTLVVFTKSTYFTKEIKILSIALFTLRAHAHKSQVQ